MTSNLGTEFVKKGGALGFVDSNDGEDIKSSHEKIQKALKSAFRPEFLNRIDDIIMFKALTLEDINRIVEIQVRLIRKRLQERKMTLELTEKAKKYIAETGFSPVYGARPLKRALQKMILDDLSMKILEGRFANGDQIRADISKNGEVDFKKLNKQEGSK